MLNDIHVIIQANNRGITLEVSHQNVLVIVKEVATEDDSLGLVIHRDGRTGFSCVPVGQETVTTAGSNMSACIVESGPVDLFEVIFKFDNHLLS
jgi:hypothetical protein